MDAFGWNMRLCGWVTHTVDFLLYAERPARSVSPRYREERERVGARVKSERRSASPHDASRSLQCALDARAGVAKVKIRNQ